MITTAEQEFQVTGNLPGQKIAMGIAADATSHIMTMLSKNLYSDPQLAVIREYSTNALDAHIEAGNTDPIQVTLPNSLSSFLRIKDFGVGLSLTDLMNIYSQYGASTKRDTNTQVGSFGLGCKAAFAYANQFTLVSVKDGRKVQVAVSRDSSGAGELTVVSDTVSSEPNGTEVVVPINRYDVQSFESKARRFFSFWTPGTVLLNGQQPTTVEGMAIGDNMLVIEGRGNSDFVVMGNVPYPVSQRIAPDLPYDYSVVARVEIGEVAIPGTREALLYDNKQTTDTLARLREEFQANSTAAVQKHVDAAATPLEAVEAASKWRKALGVRISDLTFKGQAIPAYFEHGTQPPPGSGPGADAMWIIGRYYSRLDSCNRSHKLSIESMPQAFVLTGFSETSWTATKRKKLVAYFEQLEAAGRTDLNPNAFGSFPENVILVDSLTKDQKQWVKPDRIGDWADVKAIKLATTASRGSSGRLPGSYDVWTETGLKTAVASDDIDVTKPLLYLVGNKYDAREKVSLLSMLFPQGFSLVFFGVNREDKWLRTFPKETKEVNKVIREKVKKWREGLSDDLRKAYSMNDGRVASCYLPIDPNKVKDPDIKEAIRIAKIVETPDFTKLQEAAKNLRNSGFWQEVEKISMNYERPISNYPLFDSYKFNTNPEHTYSYLNYVYQARKAGVPGV